MYTTRVMDGLLAWAVIVVTTWPAASVTVIVRSAAPLAILAPTASSIRQLVFTVSLSVTAGAAVVSLAAVRPSNFTAGLSLKSRARKYAPVLWAVSAVSRALTWKYTYRPGTMFGTWTLVSPA